MLIISIRQNSVIANAGKEVECPMVRCENWLRGELY